LLMPTTAWGTNYVAVLPLLGSDWVDKGLYWGQVVAAQDGTQVQIAPSVDLPSGANVTGAPAHQVATYSLNAGEVLQWHNPTSDKTQSMDMTGSVISSTKPIAFAGGNDYL